MKKHCDDYIEDKHANPDLRAFLEYNRLPAIEIFKLEAEGKSSPELYADYNYKRVRVVMASRFGDVGITENLKNDKGYSQRVYVEDLTNFSNKP